MRTVRKGRYYSRAGNEVFAVLREGLPALSQNLLRHYAKQVVTNGK